MSKKVFTDAERIERVWDIYEIRDLMAQHAYYNSYDMRDRELDELWVKKPGNQATASFGQNCGYQVGMDMIKKNYAAMSQLSADGGKGRMKMNLLTTPFVEIAEDGQSAQGQWYSPGHITVIVDGKPKAKWIHGRYGVDLLKEDGEWKIWHLFFGTEFAYDAGSDFKKYPVDETVAHFDVYGDMKVTYGFEAFTNRYNYAVYPAIPTPYASFDSPNVISNGPEGNPIFKKEG